MEYRKVFPLKAPVAVYWVWVNVEKSSFRALACEADGSLRTPTKHVSKMPVPSCFSWASSLFLRTRDVAGNFDSRKLLNVHVL